MLILLLGLTVYLLPHLHAPLTTYYDDAERLASLRSLLQALGGALLGAAAIVSSLVLFAMQVNVERMPYGLFRELGSDRKLLSAFAVTFVLALGVAANPGPVMGSSRDCRRDLGDHADPRFLLVCVPPRAESYQPDGMPCG
jgi:hypothetical protein